MSLSTGSPLSDRSRKKGFILVSVLLVSMFLVSATVGYGWFVRDQVRRFERRKLELECRNIALLAVKNVIKGLAMDKNSYDSVHESWFGDHLIPIGERYLVSISLLPLNDRLPLRHILLPDGKTMRGEMEEAWKKAWLEVGLPNMALPALDFIDGDREPRVGGYEREFFINRVPPDPSMFALLPEVSISSVTGSRENPGLRDFFSLWSGPKLNVNTASSTVLELMEGIDDVTAREITEIRREKPFKSLSELANMPAFSGSLGPKLTNLLGTTSDYFQVSLQVSQLGSDISKEYRMVVTKKNVLFWEEL